MSKDAKKPQTVGELISSTYFDNAQETMKKFSEQREKILDTLRPTVERIAEMKNAFTLPEINHHVLINYQPTDVLILKELRQLNAKKEKTPQVQGGDFVVVYDTNDVSLNRVIDGKVYSYDLSENGKRKRMLDLLLDKKGYVQTEELKNLLECPTTQAVAKIKQTFNDYASNTLKLNKIEIINSKKGSGYRINPKIHIEKE